MNYIDIIIIVLIIISAVKGATKGFIYEIASLIALIAGVWGAIKFSGATETFLVNRLNFTNQYIDIIAFVITFLLIIIFIHFIGKAVEKIIETISLGAINRVLGLVFSVVKTAFILGIVIVVLEKISENVDFMPKEDIQESSLYEPLRNITVSTFPFLVDFYEELNNKNEEKEQESSDTDEPESTST
ncbi:MAG: CvpA family protein [Prolixibacteraceae bacterium]|jgi:membrane protein required for colicin V production|nr:CvpA family protein [Prolixibacteraceae bacterium]